jgi:hypothetical protein
MFGFVQSAVKVPKMKLHITFTTIYDSQPNPCKSSAWFRLFSILHCILYALRPYPGADTGYIVCGSVPSVAHEYSVPQIRPNCVRPSISLNANIHKQNSSLDAMH